MFCLKWLKYVSNSNLTTLITRYFKLFVSGRLLSGNFFSYIREKSKRLLGLKISNCLKLLLVNSSSIDINTKTALFCMVIFDFGIHWEELVIILFVSIPIFTYCKIVLLNIAIDICFIQNVCSTDII